MPVYVSQNPLYLEQERRRQQQQAQQQDQQSMNPRQIQNIMDKIMQQQQPGPQNNWGGGTPMTGAEYTQSLYGGTPSGSEAYLGDMFYGAEMTPEMMGGTEAGLGGMEAGGSSFSGSGSGSGAGSGGAMAGYIIAAILGQMAATNNNPRHEGETFEGQHVTDHLSAYKPDGEGGHDWHFSETAIATEPWYDWTDRMIGGKGSEPSSGAKFDAAIKNEDWGLATKRFPSASRHWAMPGTDWFDIVKDWSEPVGWILDPIGGLLDKIEDWF